MLCLLFLYLLSLTSAMDEPKCGKNEKYFGCGACDSTCEQEEVCTMECRTPGSCGCIVGYRRDTHKACVPAESCTKKLKCGENEEIYEHGACDGTCSHPHLACVLMRNPKPECGCKKGFVRDDHKKCIKIEDC
ncbi:hypothetical protein L596_013708 [Steinernema carpocapsae]|uniref:TIL domain-containing protein n=1 Tax=Steinernema carpocapsae TaxID=34508 RepID=A0A4U5P0Z2_STECR|nr:hypothetical protein L596_013708 [Steinernema carpocapsae]